MTGSFRVCYRIFFGQRIIDLGCISGMPPGETNMTWLCYDAGVHKPGGGTGTDG
jgi:hypothetical protein